MKTLNKQQKEIRSAFTNFLLGKIDEMEARSLGVVINNGKTTIPKVVADEIIGYVQQENLLRKYGNVVKVDGNYVFPVLTNDTDIKVSTDTTERSDNEIEINHFGLTGEVMDPVEFDSISVIKKKLLKLSNISLSDLVIEVMKKEYLKKEIDYMFNGNNIKAENSGSLLNKAKEVIPTKTIPVDIIKELKNTPTTSVMNKARWIVNKEALKYVEDLKLPNGEAALKTIERTDGGVSYMLLGFPLDCTDVIKSKVDDKAVFYFGDFSSFNIQENSNGLEVEVLNETYAQLNEVGFKIHNLLDGKLIYSDLEPTVYRMEV